MLGGKLSDAVPDHLADWPGRPAPSRGRPIQAILTTRARWKAVDLPLLDESGMTPYPRMRGIQVFEGILLLVFPLHVFLLVVDRIPPHVQQLVGPGRAP